MTPARTVAFVKAFENCCTIMGWNSGTQNTTKFLNQANVTIGIVKNYGQIAKEDLKIGCELFYKAGGARYQARATQNNHMMAQCLLKSLTSAAKTRLQVYQSQYTFDGVEYGPLIYKKIMQLATIDSVATTETLHANLTNLPIYAASSSTPILMSTTPTSLPGDPPSTTPSPSFLTLTSSSPTTTSKPTWQRSRTHITMEI